MNQAITASPNVTVNTTVQAPVNSAVLDRLLREVRIEGVEAMANRYDRVHNRHNR